MIGSDRRSMTCHASAGSGPGAGLWMPLEHRSRAIDESIHQTTPGKENLTSQNPILASPGHVFRQAPKVQVLYDPPRCADQIMSISCHMHPSENERQKWMSKCSACLGVCEQLASPSFGVGAAPLAGDIRLFGTAPARAEEAPGQCALGAVQSRRTQHLRAQISNFGRANNGCVPVATSWEMHQSSKLANVAIIETEFFDGRCSHISYCSNSVDNVATAGAAGR